MKLTEQTITHIIIGSGAAGFQTALRLYQNGERDLAIITENINQVLPEIPVQTSRLIISLHCQETMLTA